MYFCLVDQNIMPMNLQMANRCARYEGSVSILRTLYIPQEAVLEDENKQTITLTEPYKIACDSGHIFTHSPDKKYKLVCSNELYALITSHIHLFGTSNQMTLIIPCQTCIISSRLTNKRCSLRISAATQLKFHSKLYVLANLLKYNHIRIKANVHTYSLHIIHKKITDNNCYNHVLFRVLLHVRKQ